MFRFNFSAINEYILKWDFVGVSLYCLLDWLKFRDIFDWESLELSNIMDFYQAHMHNTEVKNTDPRV